MKSTQPTVLYEKSLDLDLLKEISHVPGIERVKHCIQCGTCSGTCPVSWAMEDTPRKVFALIRAGMRDRVLDGTAIWTCASCYYCAVRCPQDIPITEVMYALKRRAIRENREQQQERPGALAGVRQGGAQVRPQPRDLPDGRVLDAHAPVQRRSEKCPLA